MAVIEWKQVKPDFSNSSNSMRNAMSGLSQAGTVFGEMRKSILEEEQRALENAYKQQVFDENVRQFEEQQAWNRENALAGREHDKYMADLRQEYELAQIDKRHKNDLALKAGERQRYTNALTLGTTVYNDRIKAGDTPVQALEAANTQVRNAGYGDLGIDAINFVHMADRNKVTGMLTPEYQARVAADKEIEAAAIGLDVTGKQQAHDKYTEFFKYVGSADGDLFYRDPDTGRVRPLSAEEQKYFNNVAGVREAELMESLPSLIQTGTQKVQQLGYDVPTATALGRDRYDTAIGRENRVKQISLALGADSAKVLTVDEQNAATNERANIQAAEDAKRALEKSIAENSKSATYDKHLIKFLDFKTAGDDGKSTLIGLDPEVRNDALKTRDLFMQSGIGADKYEVYLQMLTQDVRYNLTKSFYESESNTAKLYADNLLSAKDTPTGNVGAGEGNDNPPNNSEITGSTPSPSSEDTGVLAQLDVTDDIDKYLLEGLGDVLEHRQERLQRYTNMNGKMNSFASMSLPNPEKAYADMQMQVKNLEDVIKALNNNQPITWSNEAVKVAYDKLREERDVIARRTHKAGYPERLKRIDDMLKLFPKGK